MTQVGACPDPVVIVRVESLDELPLLQGLEPERIAWVETSCMEVASALAGENVGLDVVLTDPAVQAPFLYRLARLSTFGPPRVTIPAVRGVAQAGAVAVALNFPVRLLPVQPSSEAVAEMEVVLERYLHDPNASQPVEFFHSALASLTCGASSSLWEVLERDPDRFPRGQEPAESGFVERHRASLLESQAECATCPVVGWCEGYFKWPDPSYGCGDVRRLLGRLEAAAEQLRRDLAEAP